jgi:hypothetical protein
MAEMVGDGDEVVFGIPGFYFFSFRFLGNFSLFNFTVACVCSYTSPLVAARRSSSSSFIYRPCRDAWAVGMEDGRVALGDCKLGPAE